MRKKLEHKNPPKDESRQDLYFGILAPIGAEKDAAIHYLSKSLSENFDFSVETLKLSNYITRQYPEVFKKNGSPHVCKFCERRNKILYGTRLRKATSDPAILAKMAISEIRTLPTTKKDFGKRDDGKRRAFIFDQLKRREEIDFLSNLYGKSFFLIGTYAPSEQRLKRLAREIAKPDSFAQELMELDQNEKDYFKAMAVCSECRRGSEYHSPLSEDGKKTDFGQQLRDIFPLSDLFASDQTCEGDINRFLDLIFGSPREFPSAAEHAMFLAFSASTRSADLSRQVGAAILNEYGDLISVGSNDVPRAGGGIYDYRDHKNDLAFGFEANSKRLDEIANNVAMTLIDSEMVKGKSKDDVVKTLIEESELGSLTEFHRTVHAEMQAIISATRSGVSTKGGSIFVTTFPCHNCAKHIVSAGILNVIFVEPYPKSLAERLHQDALTVVEDGSQVIDKVSVRPFLGIGPRRFNDLFSMKLSSGTDVKRKAGFVAKSFIRQTAPMRFLSPISPADIERSAEKLFLEEFKEKLKGLQAISDETKKSALHDEALKILSSFSA